MCLLSMVAALSKKTGVYDTVADVLRKAGKTIVDFPGIMANPTRKKVEEGIALVTAKNIDLIVAMGGVSTIDCAKP